MLIYFLKRILYAVPIVLGVNLITFGLFFMVNSPADMARAHLGEKYVTQSAVDTWLTIHGYDHPLFFNAKQAGLSQFTQTLFFQKSLKLFTFQFGQSDAGRDISEDISQRMFPSLALAVPTLLLGLCCNILIAMVLTLFNMTRFDIWGSAICIAMMSVSGLFYIIGGQYLFGKMLQLVPISGYTNGFFAWKFLVLPVFIAVLAGVGSGARWYRTLFLEEFRKDYVKTARAKGVGQVRVLFFHVLRNALLPILTGIVVIIPTLFMGSLLMESFFAIPGLGSYTIDAIQQQDFAIVRAMVFLGTILYILGLILTDFCYAWVDPRIRLM